MALWCVYRVLCDQGLTHKDGKADASDTRIYVAYRSLWVHCERRALPFPIAPAYGNLSVVYTKGELRQSSWTTCDLEGL